MIRPKDSWIRRRRHDIVREEAGYADDTREATEERSRERRYVRGAAAECTAAGPTGAAVSRHNITASHRIAAGKANTPDCRRMIGLLFSLIGQRMARPFRLMTKVATPETRMPHRGEHAPTQR